MVAAEDERQESCSTAEANRVGHPAATALISSQVPKRSSPASVASASGVRRCPSGAAAAQPAQTALEVAYRMPTPHVDPRRPGAGGRSGAPD